MEDYSVKNTTREEREQIIKDAYLISAAGGDTLPSSQAMDIAKLYIDGKIELDEVKSKIVSLYTKGGDV